MKSLVKGHVRTLMALPLLALLGLPAAGGCAASSSDSATPSTGGSAAAELDAAYVTGDGPKTLAEAKGKVVIVDFWATYCDPCKKSFPKYQELIDQFGGDLAVIAVSVDEADTGEDKLKEFVKETQVKFPVLWDKDHKTADLYKPPNMPTSFIIDKEGKIRHVHAKYEGGEEQKIADEIKALLGQ